MDDMMFEHEDYKMSRSMSMNEDPRLKTKFAAVFKSKFSKLKLNK